MPFIIPPFQKYPNRSTVKDVTVVDGVTVIKHCSFVGYHKLEKINFPEKSLIHIGSSSFQNCRHLKNITIPDSVALVGISAFSGCEALESAKLSNGISEIYSDTFFGCTSLKSVTLPSNLKKIFTHAFFKCSALNSIDIPDYVTEIESDAFGKCDNLQQITFNKTFFKGRQLNIEYNLNLFKEHLGVPKQCKILIRQPNYEIIHANKIEIKQAPTEIKPLCLNCEQPDLAPFNSKDCDDDDSISINSILTNYSNLPCTNTPVINTLHPNTPINIGNRTFHYPKDVEFVVIPKNFTHIEDGYFENYTSLKILTLPPNINHIGATAFAGCNSLVCVVINGDIKTIPKFAFYGCRSLKSINIPNSVTNIGQRAFSECKSLKTIDILNNVTAIGAGAFSNCAALKSIPFSNNLTSIGACAFQLCRSLTSVNIPYSVKSIETDAFKFCDNLKEFTISEDFLTNHNFNVDTFKSFVGLDNSCEIKLVKTLVKPISEEPSPSTIKMKPLPQVLDNKMLLQREDLMQKVNSIKRTTKLPELSGNVKKPKKLQK